jgi:hypothetical protein
MIVLKMLATGTILMFFSSCANTNEEPATENVPNKDAVVNKLDQSVLSEYFLTNEITIDTLKHSIEVNINNSKLMAIKKEKMGKRWESPEPWVSVAATHQAKPLAEGIDSLFYNIVMFEKKYKYGYSVKQLQTANSYISICEQFASYLNSNDYISIKKLLSVDITDNYNDAQLRNFLQSTFGNEKIERTELIGTKIVGSKYSFYINFWKTSNQARTYAFSFLDGNSKIAGIQVPK